MPKFKRQNEAQTEGRDIPQQKLQGLREVFLTDEAGIQLGTGSSPLFVFQDNSVFDEILSELKIMNAYLSVQQEITLGKDDII